MDALQAADSAAAYAKSSAAGAAGAQSSSAPTDDSATVEFSAAFYRTRLLSFAAMVVGCAFSLVCRGCRIAADVTAVDAVDLLTLTVSCLGHSYHLYRVPKASWWCVAH